MPLRYGTSGNQQEPEETEKQRRRRLLMQGAGLPGATGSPEGGVNTDIFQDLARGPAPTPAPIRDTSGLQFRLPEFKERNRALRRQESELDLWRDRQLQQIGQAHERGVSRATSEAERAREALKNRMASKGLFRSSPTTDKAVEQQEDFSRFLDDLAYQRGLNEANVESELATMLNQIASQREGLFAEQGRVEEQRRLEEERAAAAAAAERARQQELQRILQAQQQAYMEQQRRQQAMLEAIASQRPPSFNVGGGGGGGFGGGGYSVPQPPPPPPSDFDRWSQGFQDQGAWDWDSAIRMAQGTRNVPDPYGQVYNSLNRNQGFFNKLARTYAHLNQGNWATSPEQLINWWLWVGQQKPESARHGGHGRDIWAAM